MDIQVEVEIQDENGRPGRRLTISVPSDMTGEELVEELRRQIPTMFKEKRYTALVESSNRPIGSPLGDGATILIKPKSGGVRIIKDEK